MLALEMMRDVEQTTYAVEAAASTRLPLWIGFSCKITDEGTIVLWDGGNTHWQFIDMISAEDFATEAEG